MPTLNDVGIVLGDTSRSRVYLQAIKHHGVLPSEAFILQSDAKRPGQLEDGQEVPYSAPWGGIDMGLSSEEFLQEARIPYTVLPSDNINDPAVVNFLAGSKPEVLVYSGFGGVLLKRDILSCGKKFLHVHGGYLPDYKGSTTNYYSYLDEGTCGASAIFMSSELDSGPVLWREKFQVNQSMQEIDHALDSCFRAIVLCSTLMHYVEKGEWPSCIYDGQGRVYYIMHPVLRHLAICSSLTDKV